MTTVFNALEFKKEFTIDWIACTFDNQQALQFGRVVGWKTWSAEVSCPSARGYKEGWELETGLRVSTSSDDSRMGTHFVFSGSTLRWYAKKSLDWVELLGMIKKYGGRTSRIDLAIDLHNSGMRFEEFSKKTIDRDGRRGRPPKFLPVGTQEDGWTVYVGVRESEKFLRVYDKAKEQGNETADYLRVELECKGEIAHALGWELPERDTRGMVDMAQTLLNDFVSFTFTKWRDWVQCQRVELSIPQGNAKRTTEWLVEICAPSLAKQIALHPNDGIMQQFYDRLAEELTQRGYTLEKV